MSNDLYKADNCPFIDFAESYADTVNPCIRVASKRAFIDGYIQAMDHEGLYCDAIQERLSAAYSNLKYEHFILKCRMKAWQTDRKLRWELFQRLKEEFKDENNY